MSPHFDDVALSCGGTVAAAVAAGHDPLIVTVFAGEPPPEQPLSEFAQIIHELMGWKGLAAAEVLRFRRSEDEAALRILQTRHVWLPHLDAPYRGPYTQPHAFRGPLHADDAELAARIAADVLELWQATPDATVYLPLGVGHHVDHRVCFAITPILTRAGVRCWHYEDFPYAAWAVDAVDQRLASVDTPFIARSLDVTSHIDRRMAAIQCYRSQLAYLFPDQSDPARRARAFAESRSPSDGAFAERYWGSPSTTWTSPLS
ncbi:MAG: PIG-L family deacetylase [Deltaproteobacteria bacterium]|nr:PIG-L family deacetylase [Nannocystaceae bacterium]